MLLSGISSHGDALHLTRFFEAKSLKSVANLIEGEYHILLRGVDRAAFDELIGEADIELV